MNEVNPYAAPGAASVARHDELPEKISRFRIEPTYRDPLHGLPFARPSIIALLAIVIVFLRYRNHAFLGMPLVPLVGVVVAWAAVSMWLRARAMKTAQAMFSTVEVVVGEHAVRRSLKAAEMLRRDVTKIYEVPAGFWLLAESANRALAIPIVLENTAALRTLLATWALIECSESFSRKVLTRAWRTRTELREGLVSVAGDDDAVAHELAFLRTIANGEDGQHALAAYRRLARTNGWLLIVFVFFLVFVTRIRLVLW